MAKKQSAEPLTDVEAFYVDNNADKTDAELARAIGKPVAAVREHLHRTQTTARISKLLIREKGAVIMTGGASEAGDQLRRGGTQQAIQAAVEREDYAEAARLQSQIRQQQEADRKESQRRTEEHIHFVKGSRGDLHVRR